MSRAFTRGMDGTLLNPTPSCHSTALTKSLRSWQETRNILIHHTLGLNFMPFGSWPLLVKCAMVSYDVSC